MTTVGDIKGQPDDAQLTRSRLSAQLLERRAQRVEFGAETGPIPVLMTMGLIIIRVGLPGTKRRVSA